jgi:hypothetical protein
MSAVTQPATINEDKMHAFLGKVVGDFGAALSSSLVYIGQKLDFTKLSLRPEVLRRQNSPRRLQPMNATSASG